MGKLDTIKTESNYKKDLLNLQETVKWDPEKELKKNLELMKKEMVHEGSNYPILKKLVKTDEREFDRLYELYGFQGASKSIWVDWEKIWYKAIVFDKRETVNKIEEMLNHSIWDYTFQVTSKLWGSEDNITMKAKKVWTILYKANRTRTIEELKEKWIESNWKKLWDNQQVEITKDGRKITYFINKAGYVTYTWDKKAAKKLLGEVYAIILLDIYSSVTVK